MVHSKTETDIYLKAFIINIRIFTKNTWVSVKRWSHQLISSKLDLVYFKSNIKITKRLSNTKLPKL
jgi:hypothetical protein